LWCSAQWVLKKEKPMVQKVKGNFFEVHNPPPVICIYLCRTSHVFRMCTLEDLFERKSL
jgi:hypothetical protein